MYKIGENIWWIHYIWWKIRSLSKDVIPLWLASLLSSLMPCSPTGSLIKTTYRRLLKRDLKHWVHFNCILRGKHKWLMLWNNTLRMLHLFFFRDSNLSCRTWKWHNSAKYTVNRFKILMRLQIFYSKIIHNQWLTQLWRYLISFISLATSKSCHLWITSSIIQYVTGQNGGLRRTRSCITEPIPSQPVPST